MSQTGKQPVQRSSDGAATDITVGNLAGGTLANESVGFEELLPNASFRELHSRVIDQPIDGVWESFLQLPANEIRLLRPLFTLRGLPAVLRGKRPPSPVGASPALELFAEEGFVMVRQDDAPLDGHAVLIFGAAGKFWAPAHNGPMEFASTEEFLAFAEPGYAKTIARFEAWDEGGSTRLETETLVIGTDKASTRKFAPYWAIIRGPSGLLRRSWLAAVDRVASRRVA